MRRVLKSFKRRKGVGRTLAVKKFCQACVCTSQTDDKVKFCGDPDCALYSFRMGKDGRPYV